MDDARDYRRELLPKSEWQYWFCPRTNVSSLIVSWWDVSLKVQSAACLMNNSPFQTFRTIMFRFKSWNVSSVIFSTG